MQFPGGVDMMGMPERTITQSLIRALPEVNGSFIHMNGGPHEFKLFQEGCPLQRSFLQLLQVQPLKSYLLVHVFKKKMRVFLSLDCQNLDFSYVKAVLGQPTQDCYL